MSFSMSGNTNWSYNRFDAFEAQQNAQIQADEQTEATEALEESESSEIRYPTGKKQSFTKDKSDPEVAAGRKAAKEMGLLKKEEVFTAEEAAAIQERLGINEEQLNEILGAALGLVGDAVGGAANAVGKVAGGVASGVGKAVGGAASGVGNVTGGVTKAVKKTIKGATSDEELKSEEVSVRESLEATGLFSDEEIEALVEKKEEEKRAKKECPECKGKPECECKDKKERRWQDSDGDGKWYEKGEDVAEAYTEKSPTNKDVIKAGAKREDAMSKLKGKITDEMWAKAAKGATKYGKVHTPSKEERGY